MTSWDQVVVAPFNKRQERASVYFVLPMNSYNSFTLMLYATSSDNTVLINKVKVILQQVEGKF